MLLTSNYAVVPSWLESNQTHGLLLILATTTRSAGRLFSVVAGQGASLDTPRLVDSCHDVPHESGASHVILIISLLIIIW